MSGAENPSAPTGRSQRVAAAPGTGTGLRGEATPSQAASRPVVLITGASSGIGAAAAGRLLRRGFRVYGTTRRVHPPEEPAGVRWVRMDVRDDGSVEQGVARVIEEASRLDALVCNAGFGLFGSVEDVPLEAVREQLDTNFLGVLRTLRAVLAPMRSAAAGRIAIVGSLAGRAPIPFQAHYSASKAAVDALALALHNEVRPLGIRVSLIEPGDVSTPFNENMHWGERRGSPYAERLARCEHVIRTSLPKAPGPKGVARAIERALTARAPRLRYTAGADAWRVPWARRLLPDRFFVWLIRTHFHV